MSLLSSIPKVDKILQSNTVRELLGGHPRPVVVAAIRTALAGLRQELLDGRAGAADLELESVSGRVAAVCRSLAGTSLRRVVNGTGVVIHTNLGRSVLPDSCRDHILDAAFGYSNLELDLATGERGSRYSHVEDLLCELTGAQAALVVNNNAAAVLLALASLAGGREVVVSRGELVEIGGSFRIPDVMAQSGAVLREVGTTNRTHPRDYHSALSPDTALLLKVHASNFAVVGFTAEVAAEELAALGREAGVPVMADLGSGCLVDLQGILPCREPTVQEMVRAGVDVITFSGDKLLGGPQAGIIVGSPEHLAPMKRHPLLRALRIDKLTLAALESTLRIYRDERRALSDIPTLRLLATPHADLENRARAMVRRLRRSLPDAVSLHLQSGTSQVGGGALPLLELPTVLVAVDVISRSAAEVEETMRRAATPVLGRLYKGRFLLDVRTILDGDIPLIAAALATLGN